MSNSTAKNRFLLSFSKKFCPGERFLSSNTAAPLFTTLRDTALASAEKAAEKERVSAFVKAVSQWLFHKPLYSADFARFNDLAMDYLVQMIIADDSVSLFTSVSYVT